ncbi:thiamine diphosphokinase [Candidatus Parcubacteria bacterium]|nr:MAG: thiamine diphosphokinase [Candidatus Parcubacteria bacterium]
MSNTKQTILIGTGNVIIDQFLSIYKEDSSLVAVDGGANHLKKLDIIPDKIIGDLDSLENKEYWKENTEIIEISDQNSTDLEKALENTQSKLYLAFGFEGERFDHTLQILHVLSKYLKKNIIFFAGTDIIFRLPKRWSIELPIYTRISLYPLHKTNILASEGLKWPVDELEMQQGHLIGISNKTVNSTVSIEQKKPNLVCVTHAKFYAKIMQTLL